MKAAECSVRGQTRASITKSLVRSVKADLIRPQTALINCLPGNAHPNSFIGQSRITPPINTITSKSW